MKIIQLTTFFYPSVGGVEKQAEEIAIHLAKNGINVEVYTTNASHGQGKMQRLNDRLAGIPIHRFKVFLRLGYFFRLAPMLVWKLMWSDFDLIHSHNIHDAHLLFAIIIAKLRGKKLVLTGHNPFIVSKEKRGGALHFLVGFYDAVFKLFAGGVDAYVALLPSEKEYVIKKFGWPEAKVAVVPNGIQDIFYENDGDAAKFLQEWGIDRSKWDLIVGTVSRINYVKGLQNLKLAADKLSRVLFVMAGGDGGNMSQIKKLYANNPNVLLTERYIAATEVKDFYQAIDIFLLPSIYEPFGLTIVEAMAQGKFVLASNVGGPSEIVPPEAGELLEPTNQQLWLERIKYYQQNRELISQAAGKAREAADQYQWPNVIQKIIEVYKQVL